MSLIYSVLSMIRAHEESDRKSQLVGDAFRKRAEQWTEGKFRGLVGSPTQAPSWVRYIDNPDKLARFELIPEKAAAWRRAIELYRAGYGGLGTAKRLEEEGLSVSEGGFNRSMQHNERRMSGGSVANETEAPDLLQRKPEGIDVGTLA
ncbi:hypothetical protein [Paraburkholderia sp. Cpub6]|uniref:hypothetical protein n=1 Tax=Paraburkholderia sp. Cpub6 TaxID=2723094 RepID=UPI0017D267C4|nr:hypothetical protein [Paraburkholderia sp. Cpub6]